MSVLNFVIVALIGIGFIVAAVLAAKTVLAVLKDE